VLLCASDHDGVAYTKTDQLDGETDWKVREAIRSIQSLAVSTDFAKKDGDRLVSSRRLHSSGISQRSIKVKAKATEVITDMTKSTPDFKSILSTRWKLKVAAPSDRLHDFSGIYTDEFGNVEPLKIQNFLLAHMSMASCDVLVQAVYVGKETKMEMNSKMATDKFGRTDKEMNDEFKVVFVACLLASLVLFFLSGAWSFTNWWTELLRIFLLLSSTLPFMLKLNAEVAKIFYSSSIQTDESIPGTIVRSRQIPEELGRIEYLLCDKTGTLTKNDMIFRQLVTLEESYGVSDAGTIQGEVDKYYSIANNPESLTLERNISAPTSPNLSHVASRPSPFHTQLASQTHRIAAQERAQIVSSLLAMLLCNNVSPTFNNNERQLQASSPDEISLVEFAESFGFEIANRKLESIEVNLPNDDELHFQILQNFPFSSDRKRMGIILKNKATKEITFYVKGADSVMEAFFDEGAQIHIAEKAHQLSSQGLRTLVVGFKKLTQADYDQFKVKMLAAQSNLKLRSELEEKCINELEKSLTFLCVTGVEDLLQDSVKTTVASIREAGINVWLLTGDKLETAKCVGISTGFKSQNQRFEDILDPEKDKIVKKLRAFNPINCLVVSGECLETILADYHTTKLFFDNALAAKSVLLCRCAPKQKAEIALWLKNRYSKIVAAIGDGGNDVGMIQSASVGIGIEGREGLQASLASDYSITKFKNVIQLFLWHGRMSFVRTSKLSGLVIHRGFLFVTIQFLFMCVFHFVSIRIYHSYLTMLYGTLFTNLIVFSVIFDTDIPKHQALNYPSLYKLVQNGKDTSTKSMLIWKAQAVYQGAIIILFSLIFFPNLHAEIHTITFTALIFIEYLNIFTVITTWHRMMTLSLLISIACYLVCLFPLSKIVDLTPMDQPTLARILLLVLFGWLPMQMMYLVQELCYPTPVQKLINEATIQETRKRHLQLTKSKKHSSS
jgi:phospholipid-translocating ATPase